MAALPTPGNTGAPKGRGNNPKSVRHDAKVPAGPRISTKRKVGDK